MDDRPRLHRDRPIPLMMEMTMTTLQENRHRKTLNSIEHAMAQREACIGKLVKLELKLRDLHRLATRQQKALAKAMAAPRPPGPATKPSTPPPDLAVAPPGSKRPAPSVAEIKDDLDPPAYLDRRKQAEAADAAARARI